MKKLRDFKCLKCTLHFEDWADDEQREIKCKSCNGQSVRQLSAPRVSGNTTGRSPSYASRK